jgi:hypothetical protein
LTTVSVASPPGKMYTSVVPVDVKDSLEQEVERAGKTSAAERAVQNIVELLEVTDMHAS